MVFITEAEHYLQLAEDDLSVQIFKIIILMIKEKIKGLSRILWKNTKNQWQFTSWEKKPRYSSNNFKAKNHVPKVTFINNNLKLMKILSFLKKRTYFKKIGTFERILRDLYSMFSKIFINCFPLGFFNSNLLKDSNFRRPERFMTLKFENFV